MLTVPNLLSCVRFLSIPVLLGFAWFGYPRAFLGVLIVSLLTDGVDGYLARKLNQMTDLGAKLDSWADMATWLVLPFCAWWLRPEVLREEAVWLVVGIGAYLGSILLGFAKYHRLISYHTWGAKALAWLVGAAVLVFFANGPGWVFRIVMPVVALSAVEEMAMTILLPTRQTNVPTFWHALKLRRRNAEGRSLRLPL
jgi:CDP-diacylglycerol--glycerol-3-phosphate 3-phosphatidyltransferase